VSRNRGTYEALVAADTASEAIAIASEAMPRGAELVSSEATREPGAEATFRVTLKFRRETSEEGGY
jgi:hypothetical protein